MADKDGLLQLIRPAQARFINDIRMTTPSFRPFERKSGPKSLPQAKFLLDEEGDEDEDSSGDQEFCSVFEDNNVSIVGLKRKRGSAIVYIDDVLERAHQQVNYVLKTFKFSNIFFHQSPYTRTSRKLSVRCAKSLY